MDNKKIRDKVYIDESNKDNWVFTSKEVDTIQDLTRADERYFLIQQIKLFIADLEVLDEIDTEKVFIELRNKLNQLKTP